MKYTARTVLLVSITFKGREHLVEELDKFLNDRNIAIVGKTTKDHRVTLLIYPKDRSPLCRWLDNNGLRQEVARI
jgi:hypothetical protein